MTATLEPRHALYLKEAFFHLARGAQEQALASLRAALDTLDGLSADPVVYDLTRCLAAVLGQREEAIEFFIAAQARHPDLPLSRAVDFRLRQRQATARGRPAILLVTQFKSASVFLTDVLAKGLDLPTCYVACAPLAERVVPEWLRLFARGGAVAQNHLLPSAENVAALNDASLRRFVVHIRDPRQSMISAVHHYAQIYHSPAGIGILTRAEFPEGFPDWPDERKIDYYLDRRFAEDVTWTEGWIALAKTPPAEFTIKLTNFETFRRDPNVFFSGLLEFFGIAPATFDWAALGEPRSKQLHFRKGETQEWRRVLTPGQSARATAMLPPTVADYFATMA